MKFLFPFLLLLAVNHCSFSALFAEGHSAPPVKAVEISEEHNDEDPISLGTILLNDYTYFVFRHGEIKAGAEAVISVVAKESGAAAEMRVWVGAKNARGSKKALLRANKDALYHGHIIVPDELDENSRIWLEVLVENGRVRTSIAYHIVAKNQPEEK